MPTTLNLDLPFPSLSDGNSPPEDIQALAEALDAYLVGTASVTPTLAADWSQGVTNGTRYQRRAGFVTVQIFATKASYADGETIFTLPAGFRPALTVYFAAHYGEHRAGMIEPSGAVKSNTTGVAGFIGTVTFPVA